MFDVRFSRKAQRFVYTCEYKLRNRLRTLFEEFKENPIPVQEQHVIKVKGHKDTYRVRLSSYRVVYVIYWDTKIVRVLKIERRNDSTYDF